MPKQTISLDVEMLTPSEIDSLRRETRENYAKIRRAKAEMRARGELPPAPAAPAKAPEDPAR